MHYDIETIITPNIIHKMFFCSYFYINFSKILPQLLIITKKVINQKEDYIFRKLSYLIPYLRIINN